MVGGGIRVEVDGRGAMDELVDADDDDGKGPRNEYFKLMKHGINPTPIHTYSCRGKQGDPSGCSLGLVDIKQ